VATDQSSSTQTSDTQQDQQQQSAQAWQQPQQYSGAERRSQRDFDFLFQQMQGQQTSAAELTRTWAQAYITQVRQDVSMLESLTSAHLLALSKTELTREIVQSVVPIVASQVRQDLMDEIRSDKGK
jgi:hypothetical protein